MAQFCGINYDDLKSLVNLSCTYDEGVNVRQGVELNSNLVRKMEKNTNGNFAGETYRAGDGSVRVRLQDGSGWASILSMEGTAFLSPPPSPAVESSTDSERVSTITIRVKTHRFLASYLTALKGLGFTTNNQHAAHLPAVLIFHHPDGVSRDQVVQAFTPLVEQHISKFYAFPKPDRNRSEQWFRYEMWMEYKKEVAIWAD